MGLKPFGGKPARKPVIITTVSREEDQDLETLDRAIRTLHKNRIERIDEYYNEYLKERCEPGKDVEKLDEDFIRKYEDICAEFKSDWKEYLNNRCEVQKRMSGKAIFPLPIFPPEKFSIAKIGFYCPEHYMSMLMMRDIVNPQLTKKISLWQFLGAAWRKAWQLILFWIAILILVCGLSFFMDSSSANAPLANFGENLYTALMAFTTVGYGDLSPGNGWGRFISIILGFLGIVSISLFTTIAWTAAQESGSTKPQKKKRRKKKK